MFVAHQDADTIEAIRRAYNPIQSQLIPSHITLCREDEIENLAQVIDNLINLTPMTIEIAFGHAIRFDNGQGVMLPAKGEQSEFQTLRKCILNGIVDNPRIQLPHITLIHPRTATCTTEMFEHIKATMLPTLLTFRKISLIEQKDGGVWRILQVFESSK